MRSMPAIYCYCTDHSRDHLLANNELITKIVLPAPIEGEKAAYFRASARARAEWAIIECVARLTMDGKHITSASIAVGAVAPVPMRLPEVEKTLLGKTASEETFYEAASLAANGANPLPQTGYKVPLLVNSVAEALLRACGMAG